MGMVNDRRPGVYRIVNKVNGKAYTGSSVNVGNRFTQHLSDLRKGCHKNPKLQASWNKYGEDNFRFEPIFFCLRHEVLLQEQVLLDSGVFEFNIAEYAHAPMLNVKRTQEFCDKMREAQTGRKQSQETIQKRVSKTRGMKRTNEQRARMSLAAKKRGMSTSCRDAHKSWADSRSIPLMAVVVATGEVELYKSLTDADKCGYNMKSVSRRLAGGKMEGQAFKGRIWSRREP